VERNLQKKLVKEESLRQEEMRSLFEIFQIEPRVLNDFIEDMEYEFEQISQNLQNQAVSSNIIMVEVYQSIHAIKANALILGLEKFAAKLHDMESKIKQFRDKGDISFDDVLEITVDLEMLLREKDKLNALVERLQSFKLGGSGERRQEEYVLVKTLTRACEKTAEDLGKKVQLEIKGIDKRALELGPRRVIREVLTQLVKNAVAHGIEPREERSAGGKAETGRISISIRVKEDQIYIRSQDDGRGLDFAAIQQKARDQHLFSNPEDLEDRRRLLQVIFTPGFSTAREVNLHAGRGIGLNMVRQRIQEVKGTIKLQTEPGKGTVFNIIIPLKQDKEKNIVPFVDRRKNSSGAKQA
jgi:two-component system chemotaxis sensor kinase CheA